MIRVGIDHERGETVRLPIPGDGGAHWLVGGSTGAGKTEFAHLVLHGLAGLEHTAIVISDPAWLDYDPWASRASATALGRGGALWMLEQAERELDWRLREGRRRQVKRIEPCADLPRIVLVFDEVAMVTLSGVKGVTNRLIDIAQVGRKVAIGLVLLTQSPKSTVIPRLVTEQCPVRVCLRTEEPEQTDAVLGTQRIPAHRISFDRPGEAFVRLPNGRVAHIRAALVGEDECRARALATAHLAPVLPAERGWKRLYDPKEEEAA